MVFRRGLVAIGACRCSERHNHQYHHHHRRHRCQQRLKREESLRSIPISIPRLPDPGSAMATLEAGDWLAQLRPLVGDVATKGASWWDGVMEKITEVYNR